MDALNVENLKCTSWETVKNWQDFTKIDSMVC